MVDITPVPGDATAMAKNVLQHLVQHFPTTFYPHRTHITPSLVFCRSDTLG